MNEAKREVVIFVFLVCQSLMMMMMTAYATRLDGKKERQRERDFDVF